MDVNESQLQHNWMYSFMPGFQNRIFLVGFCKNCRNAFSELIPVASGMESSLRITKMNVPKWGCEPIQMVDGEH